MVEFLRLKVIIRDDLSGTLRTWQADMDKFLRDLDAVTQTSTTLPSKNAAVGVTLCQFQVAAQLRLALPLTRLDEARGDGGIHSVPSQGVAIPARDKESDWGAFLKDYGPSR